MTEPLDLDDTITVARLRAVVRGQGLSIAAMSKEIRERDTEITRLKAPAAVWEERLGAVLAEITRLRVLTAAVIEEAAQIAETENLSQYDMGLAIRALTTKPGARE